MGLWRLARGGAGLRERVSQRAIVDQAESIPGAVYSARAKIVDTSTVEWNLGALGGGMASMVAHSRSESGRGALAGAVLPPPPYSVVYEDRKAKRKSCVWKSRA